MEDRNKISGDEVNRIDDLARIVHRFKFVTAGDGKIIGGFGKLPENFKQLPPEQRLQHLRNATNNFSVTGQNVDVAGNFDDGFIFS